MATQLATMDIPQDLEAEQAILGAIIYHNDLFSDAGILIPTSFYHKAHQNIFIAMLELGETGQPIDEVLIGDQLKSLGQLDESGGYPYLAELVDCVPSSGNIVQYIKIVQEHALLRDLITTTTEIARKSRNPERNITELLAEAESKISEISLRSTDKHYFPVKEVLAINYKRLEKISETSDEITGLETKFAELDKLTAGLQPTDLIIIAARPSMGKTALAMNIATNVGCLTKKAADKTKPIHKGGILIFSLEMSKEQLVMRMMTTRSKINSKKLRTGNLEQEDWNKLALATEELSTAPIFINDSSNLTPFELVSISKQLHKEHKDGLSLIIVDYLQLMKSSRNVPREQEIAEISRSLKGLAKELNIPVIALSQLNRSLESRSDKVPVLSDLRESGAIEQDADLIMFIYRDEVYNKESAQQGQALIKLAKHRNGPTGEFYLTFIGKYTSFSNMSNLQIPG